ncbi:MAG: cytidylate kinase-like family protein [Dehalococcoidia bacterium]|nr:cytidylate kinase-like family protein [Dehalococcoidia bacterium]
MPIITISGNLGSGAREIAQDLARELALDYVDQEILVEAARQLGVSVAVVERQDERARSLAERLGMLMRTLMERSAVATDPMSGAGLDVVLARTYGEAAELPEGGDEPLNEQRYLETLTSVIRGIAVRGSVVILGRGSQAILRDDPAAFHVYVHASHAARIAMLSERDQMPPADAMKRIKESDHNRAAFHHRFFKVDAESPALYDLVVNTERIAGALAVRLIALAVRGRPARALQEPTDVPQP